MLNTGVLYSARVLTKDYSNMEAQLRTPADPEEDTACHFDKLSNEVLCKIMSCMTLKYRAHFIAAYPRIQALGQSAYFKTRQITASDIDLSEDLLENVLDPFGTTIKVSVDYPDIVFKPFPTNEVLKLMPNLQEIILKDFTFFPKTCNCPKSEESIFHCPSWKPLLAKVKSLTFDNCRPSALDWCNDRGFYFLWLGVMYGNIFQKNLLRKATFLNTLTPENLKKLVCSLIRNNNHGKNMKIALDVRDTRGNSFDLSDILIRPVLGLAYDIWSPCVDHMKKSMLSTTFLKFEVTRYDSANLCFRLTHDLDIEVLESKVADIVREQNQIQWLEMQKILGSFA